MKKTTKSPENVEVTPNKKKLKQARLPFMLLSDVSPSPKPETPPARKRKLSVPDEESVTKVGKLSKENSISEELVVISDDDSKGVSGPKKQEKQLNPYVKIVDAARKKKLQKSKAQKKSKTRSSKKLSSGTSKIESPRDNDQNSGCEDVEMVEVDVLIHEENDKEAEKIANDDVELESDDTVSETKNSNKNSDEEVKSLKNSPKMKSGDQKSSVNKNISNDSVEPSKNSKLTQKVSEIICLEDSNNSADVKMTPSSKTQLSTLSTESKHSANEKDTKSSDKLDSLDNKQIDPKKKSQKSTVTPKRSPRNKTNKKDDTATPKQMECDKKDTTSDNQMTDQKSKDPAIEMADSASDGEDQSVDPPKSSDQGENSQESSKDDTKAKSPKGLVTPKRSSRIKLIDEANNLNMSTSSKLDETISSDPSTPKNNKSLSENGQLDKSLNESLKTANLTPKQIQKKLEAVKKREEREKEKQERELKRQQEKDERAKQRQEKEDQRKREREEKEEAKRREREEKEEQKKKEREEKEKQREEEKKVKEEQKRKEREDKEEQRRKEKEAREDEKKKKQEAFELEKQEQEIKKKKAAEAFANFFVPKQKVDKHVTLQEKPVSKNDMLSSFTIKIDMRLAPTTRNEISDEQKEALVKHLEEQNSSETLYLNCLKNGVTKPLTSGKTWPLDDKDDDDDVMIVEDELPLIDGAGEVITCESAPREKLRPKLFSFHENRRPPYWGTWRKKSTFIKARRPFGQDEKQLDYEVDSDDDWEDEGDGESLDGSAGGSEDEAGADDYEVDNEVFVPHGYLSDEEATMDEEDDVLSLSPETQKAKLKHLEDEFESEMKKPTEKLKPRLYGLLWENSDGGKPEKCVDALWNYFEKYAMIMNDVTPLLQPLPEPEEAEKKKVKKKKALAEGEGNDQSPKSEKKKKAKAENKEKKPKQELKKPVPNQPGINSFLKKVQTT